MQPIPIKKLEKLLREAKKKNDTKAVERLSYLLKEKKSVSSVKTPKVKKRKKELTFSSPTRESAPPDLTPHPNIKTTSKGVIYSTGQVDETVFEAFDGKRPVGGTQKRKKTSKSKAKT